MDSTKLIRQALLIAIAILVFLGAGCTAPLNHIGVFSQASAELAKRAADAYEDVNETTIERRIYTIAANPSASPDDAAFDKLITDSNLAARISMLRDVEQYANALGQLASADFRSEIDSASKDLYGALGKLQRNYADATKKTLPLSEKNLALVATAIDAIGVAIVEKQRQAALKEVVIQADPALQDALQLTSDELPMLKSLVLANMDTIWTEKVKAYQQEAPNLSFDQRVERLRDIRKSHDVAISAARLLDDLSAASRKLAQAHATLRVAATADNFTSTQLTKEIKGLAELAQSIKEFHAKLVNAEAT